MTETKRYEQNIKDFDLKSLRIELKMCERKMYAGLTLHLLDISDYYYQMCQFIKSRIMAHEINLKHNLN